jgi:hypothetical protein
MSKYKTMYTTIANKVYMFHASTFLYGALRKLPYTNDWRLWKYEQGREKITRPLMTAEKGIVVVASGVAAVGLWPMLVYTDILNLQLKQAGLDKQWKDNPEKEGWSLIDFFF